MIKTLTALVCFVFICSCNCQKPVQKENNVLVSNSISQFLGDKNFTVLQHADTVMQFDIEKKLIEGTRDEYSNKLVVKDTLETKRRDEFLLKLRDDSFYDWKKSNKNLSFEPNKQFLLKADTGKLTVMLDEKRGILGFISIDGQRLVFIVE